MCHRHICSVLGSMRTKITASRRTHVVESVVHAAITPIVLVLNEENEKKKECNNEKSAESDKGAESSVPAIRSSQDRHKQHHLRHHKTGTNNKSH